MTKRRLRSVKDIVYRGRPTRPDEGAFSEVESSEETPEEFLSESIMTLPVCAGCGAVIHDPSEAGGMCSIGQEMVCTKCESRMRCLLCGLVVCRAHSRPFAEGFICRHHTFLETFILPRRDDDE